MQLFQEALRQLEEQHPEGVTIEQIQELANEVSKQYHECEQRPHDRPADRR